MFRGGLQLLLPLFTPGSWSRHQGLPPKGRVSPCDLLSQSDRAWPCRPLGQSPALVLSPSQLRLPASRADSLILFTGSFFRDSRFARQMNQCSEQCLEGLVLLPRSPVPPGMLPARCAVPWEHAGETHAGEPPPGTPALQGRRHQTAQISEVCESPHFADEITEAQGSKEACPRPQSREAEKRIQPEVQLESGWQ